MNTEACLKEHSIAQEPKSDDRLHWSPSHTRRLFRQYQQTKNKDIRDEIFSYYENLASLLARRYAYKGIAYDDLYQEGCLGLLVAIERYDVSRGVQFATFAFYYIRGHIVQFFRSNAWPCYVPREYKEMSVRIRNLADELGHELSKSEIVDLLDIPEKKADAALAATKVWEPVCLHKADCASDLNPTILQYVSCEDRDLELVPERICLQDAVARELSPEEVTIIHLYYYEQISQSEIARMLGTYQMMVSRLLHKATDKLAKVICVQAA